MLNLDGVVKNGFCVGCGACSVASHGEYKMRVNEMGAYEPVLGKATDNSTLDAVCPFTDYSENETKIAEKHYSEKNFTFDARIGYYDYIGAGRRTDRNIVVDSSSGGLTSWLTEKLLEKKLIDGVIHVGQPEKYDGRLFGYVVSENIENLANRKKSQYYATTYAEVLLKVRGNGKKYAFVGVPCFVKSMRLLCQSDEVLREQIIFFIGLVCGHLKTSAFAEVMALQTGVQPDDLENVDFRKKIPENHSNAYGFSAQSKTTNKWHTEVSRELLGGNWGHALFQLKACDYCDDIFAETADICFGDAWLPRYEREWQGTNLIVSRNTQLQSIVKEGQASGEIFLEPLQVTEAEKSQAGNFRHRRDGLSVRLADAMRRGQPIPVKRVKPGSISVSYLRKRLVRTRQDMAAQSHVIYQKSKSIKDYDYFMRTMRVYTKRMERIYFLEKIVNFRDSSYKLYRKIAFKFGYKV